MNKYEEAHRAIEEQRAAFAQKQEEALAAEEERQRAEAERLATVEKERQENLRKFRAAQPEIVKILRKINSEVLRNRGSVKDWRQTRSGIHEHQKQTGVGWDTSWYHYNHESEQLEARLEITDGGVVSIGLPLADIYGDVGDVQTTFSKGGQILVWKPGRMKTNLSPPKFMRVYSSHNPNEVFCFVNE